jgi:N-glycosylase/DNA lyase
MSSVTWSPWETLPWAPAAAVLAETLDGGQAFRWRRGVDGDWTGVWAGYVARLRFGPATLEWSAPNPVAPGASAAIRVYFACNVEWDRLTNELPWRSDAHLAAALAGFPGLRVLRQPFGEALLAFLCSATKQIVQIKQMCELLAERFGAELAGGYRALPTWERLAQASEAELRACRLGFRARHIHAVARFLAERSGWLEETAAAPYPTAKARLLELPGVGEKVADCVLLFGAGQLEALPVDVWILRALRRHYGLDGWTPAQVAHFGRVHFGPQAGLAQQFLFAWERAHGARRRERPAAR